MKDKILVTYGKSIYGGWYAEYFHNGKWHGIHGKSKKELLHILLETLGRSWAWGKRFDNI